MSPELQQLLNDARSKMVPGLSMEAAMVAICKFVEAAVNEIEAKSK